MKRRATLLFTAALGIAVAGCGDSSVASGPGASPVAPKTASAAPPAQTSSAASPAKAGDKGDILSVLSVEHQVDVSAERDGVIVSLTKDEGAFVKADETLGQIDDRSLQMELIKARDDLKVSQNNVKYKEAELKARSAAYRRQQQLRALGLSSDADLEAAEFSAKAAEFDLRGWEALVESSQAQIRKIEIETDQTRLHAQFAGVVVRRYVREGQTVAKGEKCFRVSQLAPLQVQFQVPESSVRHPERGSVVELSLMENSKRVLSAKIVKISPTIDPASDSYNVTAQLTGPGISDLRPGMAVRIVWPGTARTKP
ncbi:MAG: efflux RND transporter periplasmic adaptor subunit [Candidatus Acidiferrales bacterium]